MDIEPRPTRTRAGQVMTRTHQRLIDLAIDSLQDEEDSGLSDLETDYDNQESVNVIPQFEVQDDSMIEFMHNINIMTFPDEIIRTNKHTDCTFTQHRACSNRANRTTIGVAGCIRQWRFRSI